MVPVTLKPCVSPYPAAVSTVPLTTSDGSRSKPKYRVPTLMLISASALVAPGRGFFTRVRVVVPLHVGERKAKADAAMITSMIMKPIAPDIDPLPSISSSPTAMRTRGQNCDPVSWFRP